jgi:hypothetical protein
MSRPGLWQQSDFLKLWTGQTVSQIRSAVSSPGIPLTALYVRHAPPGLTGILIDWITAPFAILTHAISFLFSAAAIELIRKSEPNPTPHPTPPTCSAKSPKAFGPVGTSRSCAPLPCAPSQPPSHPVCSEACIWSTP